MSTSNPSRIPKDIAKVELTEEWELAYWTQHFNVSEDDLRAALKEAGNATDQVTRHLESRPEKK